MRDDRQEDRETAIDATRAASATECTGLVPALPVEDSGVDRLTSLYDVVPPKDGEKRRRHK